MLPDPTDSVVLEAALAGRADAIVTGDRHHLLPLKRIRDIPIMTPRAFLEFLDHDATS